MGFCVLEFKFSERQGKQKHRLINSGGAVLLCARRDLNSHVLRHWNLNPARLPIPPRARCFDKQYTFWITLRKSSSSWLFRRFAVGLVAVSTSPDQQPRRFKIRLWHVLFLAILVACTFGLAWWQWTRFQSGTGTFQNLGYAIQWPFFGGFFVYAYRKFVEYENQRLLGDDELFGPKKDIESPTEIDESFLPQRRELTVEEFNRLNQPERRKQ